ncbi:NADH:flavin oxidoreductase [Halobium salinum]|uniref:NADH:flavin oxidoreductase n=1 Tax=Halobium salinum TaxID=1364940 RepID=A0ABD5PH86_9EURY|nr:NADH:flavin oxidoreductase [Halobium salinum]
MTDDPLFESFDLDGLDLDNRVGLAPMTRTSATDDGHATDEMARYYAKFAEGGFSFLVTEGIYTDTDHSQGYANQPGLATDEQADSWEPVVDRVHDAGAPVFAQLMHAGALVQGNRWTDETVGPSAVRPKGEQLEMYGGEGQFAEPQELSTDELDGIRETFVVAAERAAEAGFDGVEVHGANGYLLDQFLTAYTNQRDDEYGGDVESRVRFPTEVLQAVADATPDGFVVGVRLSQSKVNDPDYRWEGEAEAEAVFDAFSAAGADYLHVTEADVTAPAFEGDAGDTGDGGNETDATLAELAAEYGDAPVVANGGLEDPEAARATVEAGADLITLGTGALANPDWPTRVENDEPLADLDFERVLQPDASIDDSEVPSDD